MKSLLTITDVPVGSYSRGPFIIVETKEVGNISIAYMDHQLSISGYPDDWGGEVKKINVDIKEVVEEKEPPEELKGLKVIKLEKTSKELEIPEELVRAAIELALMKIAYEQLYEEFMEKYLATLKNLFGRLKSSKGDRLIGGRK